MIQTISQSWLRHTVKQMKDSDIDVRGYLPHNGKVIVSVIH